MGIPTLTPNIYKMQLGRTLILQVKQTLKRKRKKEPRILGHREPLPCCLAGVWP